MRGPLRARLAEHDHVGQKNKRYEDDRCKQQLSSLPCSRHYSWLSNHRRLDCFHRVSRRVRDGAGLPVRYDAIVVSRAARAWQGAAFCLTAFDKETSI